MLAWACGRGSSTCESMWANDCKSGCSCPEGLECRIYSDGLESSGRNACFKRCSASSECPESTVCVEVTVGLGGTETEVQGQCWPACDGIYCPVGTHCHRTQLYLDAGAIRACY